ncbi:hypothetical protein CDAR_438591 [Caerostris darwini]|uniref:Uncharacterized protein n=1 Tax=Caerostris darwini TaxID=1538125 RepID=A0AAV4X4R3_9ARAC|nr:hypothetical protein CDAR_438591 [Caerostris darwini]
MTFAIRKPRSCGVSCPSLCTVGPLVPDPSDRGWLVKLHFYAHKQHSSIQIFGCFRKSSPVSYFWISGYGRLVEDGVVNPLPDLQPGQGSPFQMSGLGDPVGRRSGMRGHLGEKKSLTPVSNEC